MIVAGADQHAAIFRRAGGVAVLQHVAAAVDARALAVPHGEDAVAGGVREQGQLLAAPDGGHRQVFVDARFELDAMALEIFLGAPQVHVEPAEGRAAIAADKAAGVESRRQVALALHHRQADQRLDAGQKNAAFLQFVLVFQGNFSQRQGGHGIEGSVRSEMQGSPVN